MVNIKTVPSTSDVSSLPCKISKINSKDDVTQLVDSEISSNTDFDRCNLYTNTLTIKSQSERKDKNIGRNKASYFANHNGVDRLEFDLTIRSELVEIGEKRKVANGLITESINSAIRYVSEQADYSYNISKDVLSNICSDFTNEKIVLQYASNFDKESFASSLDIVNEISNNIINSKSNEDNAYLRSVLSSLTPIYNAQQDYLKSQRKFKASLMSKDKEVKENDRTYRDFTLLEQDLYARTSNPHLHMNEIAVIMFTEAFNSVN